MIEIRSSIRDHLNSGSVSFPEPLSSGPIGMDEAMSAHWGFLFSSLPGPLGRSHFLPPWMSCGHVEWERWCGTLTSAGTQDSMCSFPRFLPAHSSSWRNAAGEKKEVKDQNRLKREPLQEGWCPGLCSSSPQDLEWEIEPCVSGH